MNGELIFNNLVEILSYPYKSFGIGDLSIFFFSISKGFVGCHLISVYVVS